MEIKVQSPASPSNDEENRTPLLKSGSTKQREDQNSLIAQAMSQTFKSTAYLASRLPTGALLAFQLLSPIFSNQGECDKVRRYLTGALVALCGLSCFMLSFTDSVKDSKGKVYHGFATFKGFWIIDRTATLKPEEAAKMRIDPTDFLHGLMSMLVFASIALLDKNTVHCFYPTPSTEIDELLSALPIGIGVICSSLFVTFPTQRHGIGFVVSTTS